MIDTEGYRLNVGMIICNHSDQLFWARKIGRDTWQFPQGGIRSHEDPETAMYRELYEETGLTSDHVRIMGRTRGWLQYRLPQRFIRRDSQPLCIGQKQLWYLLRLVADDSIIRFDCTSRPEFDAWCWVDYWLPLHDVVYFKRDVYRRALSEFAGRVRPRGKRSSGPNRRIEKTRPMTANVAEEAVGLARQPEGARRRQG